MMLVFTPCRMLSYEEAKTTWSLIEGEVRVALGIDKGQPLPVGILLLDPGDKLELLQVKEPVEVT